MFTTTLKNIHGHLYITLDGHDWLLDTGSPKSFGNTKTLTIDSQEFAIKTPPADLSTFQLSLYIDHETFGLIGTDILNHFNVLLDLHGEKVTFSTKHLELKGEHLPLSSMGGTPIIDSEVGHKHYAMFFDTGAPLSYCQDSSLTQFPAAGVVEDFYPGTGHFTTDSYAVDMSFGNQSFTLQCGALPLELDTMVHAMGADGIIGNDIVAQREVGYFALENEIVIGSR